MSLKYFEIINFWRQFTNLIVQKSFKKNDFKMLTLALTLTLTGHLPHRSSSVQASGHATARNSSKHFSHCRLKTSLHVRI